MANQIYKLRGIIFDVLVGLYFKHTCITTIPTLAVWLPHLNFVIFTHFLLASDNSGYGYSYTYHFRLG